MQLKKVVIQNYRSCLRTSIDLHPQLSVLIGPNSSGKTNILQAILFLHKMAREAGRPSLRSGIPVTSRFNATFEDGQSQIRFNSSVDSYTDETNNDVMMASRQKWSLLGPNRKEATVDVPLSAVTPSGLYWGHRRFFSQSDLQHHFYMQRALNLAPLPSRSQKWIWPLLRRVAEYCLGIKYYGASQFTNPGTCPTSFEIEQEGSQLGSPRLRGHAKILYSMYLAQRGHSNLRYKQFIDVVGPSGLGLIDALTFNQFRTSSVDYSVRVGGKIEGRKRNKVLVVPQFRLGKQTLSPNQLSEGTFKTLALLFHVITEESTVLLIEEPEVCVHHGLLSSILELIKTSSRKKQMILSTHSDYVLDHVDPENVYRVSFDKSVGTVVRHIRKTMTAKEFSALRDYLEQEGNLGEFWREGGLGDRP